MRRSACEPAHGWLSPPPLKALQQRGGGLLRRCRSCDHVPGPRGSVNDGAGKVADLESRRRERGMCHGRKQPFDKRHDGAVGVVQHHAFELRKESLPRNIEQAAGAEDHERPAGPAFGPQLLCNLQQAALVAFQVRRPVRAGLALAFKQAHARPLIPLLAQPGVTARADVVRLFQQRHGRRNVRRCRRNSNRNAAPASESPMPAASIPPGS